MQGWWAGSFVAVLALGGCAKNAEPKGMGAGDLPEGVRWIETIEAAPGEIRIPYRKYALDNGLTVVLHEDRSDPLVHVDVTYHVGSAREDRGRSGFAHFFEHMMFQGSANVADEEHFRVITEAGGTLNGTTNRDRTNYFETAPSNQLEKMLWLEADRMGFLLPAVTQEKFENQRETVKNERNQRYDNRPYGLLRERVGEAMYPEGHPYSWLTIGYIEDLNRADLDDLKRFFLRWYGPNNAVLTIGGDFDQRQALEWAAKYFGPIPKGPEVEAAEPAPVTLDADRYISMEDNVSLPLIQFAYPTVHRSHPDEAPLDVLMTVLGGGRTSLLYKNLVKPGNAVQAQAGHPCEELHCQFSLTALPNPASGTTLADLEAAIDETLAEFEERGVEDDDLTRTKMSIVAGQVFGLESVSGKVSALASFETFEGTPDHIQAEIARYENVTKEDVMRVYETYIKDRPAVIMSIVPEGQADAVARPDNFTPPERVIPEGADEGALALREPVDSFDRSVAPSPADTNPAVGLPPIWRAALPNGIAVLGAPNEEVPTTAMTVRVGAGQRFEPLDKLGLAAFTARMLNEATARSTSEDLSNRLAKLGSSVSIRSGNEFGVVQIRALTENLDETIAIAAEKLLEPKFDEADFERVKAQTLQNIEQAKKQASNTASLVVAQKLYGTDNAIAHRDIGTTASVTAITLEDVKAFYEQHYKAGSASVVAVSSLDQAALMATLQPLEAWTGDAAPAVPLNAFPELNARTLYLVDKPGAAQSQIWFAKRALSYDATGEFYRSNVMNFALGGAFNSRINLNLREDKGYSYGARSRFRGERDRGSFTASAGVRTDATGDAIVQFVKELSTYQKTGITPEELAFTKRAIGQGDARRFETPNQKLNLLADIVVYNVPESFLDERNAILEAITKAEIDALAAKHVTLDEMILVVVGDKSVIGKELEAAGYPIVELDADGAPLP